MSQTSAVNEIYSADQAGTYIFAIHNPVSVHLCRTKFKKGQSTLILTALIQLRCTRTFTNGTPVADNTHQKPPLIFKHLSNLPPPGIESIGVKWLLPEGDSLLHVGGCCKSLASRCDIRGSEKWTRNRSWKAEL